MSNVIQKLIYEYKGYQYSVNINHDEAKIYHFLKKDGVDVELPDYVTNHYGNIVDNSIIEQIVDSL